MKKINFLSILLLFLVFFLTGCYGKSDFVVINQTPKAVDQDAIVVEEKASVEQEKEIIKEVENKPVTVEIPSSLDLKVPFVSQAPLRVWDVPYNEACEEATMISVAYYFKGLGISNEQANKEILDLIAWEEDHGYKVDATAQETVQILKDYFGLDARLETEVTVDRIKYELSLGNPIIIPTSGRTLGNPYFQTPGPIYHMLVIRGYDSDEFITNDVGTNTKGEAFKYKYQVIIDSIHDWDHKLAADGMADDEILMGQKVMIVVLGK